MPAQSVPPSAATHLPARRGSFCEALGAHLAHLQGHLLRQAGRRKDRTPSLVKKLQAPRDRQLQELTVRAQKAEASSEGRGMLRAEGRSPHRLCFALAADCSAAARAGQTVSSGHNLHSNTFPAEWIAGAGETQIPSGAGSIGGGQAQGDMRAP